MGMDPLTLGMIIAGGGQLVNAGTSWANQSQANKQLDQNRAMLMPFLNQGPSPYESMMQQLVGQAPKGNVTDVNVPSAASLLGGQGYNTGQDALMQLLRANPQTQVDASLEGMMQTGNPFDTSKLFEALNTQDQRQTAQMLGQLQGSAGSLGERFGSSMLGSQNDLLAQLSEQFGTRNAQIAQGSHEAAQSRKLEATSQATGREQFGTQMQQAVAQLLTQLGMGEAQLGLQVSGQQMDKDRLNRQGEMDSFQAQLGALSQLLGASQGRMANNTNLLSLLFGIAPSQQSMMGNSIGDIGQLLMFLPMLRSMGGGNG